MNLKLIGAILSHVGYGLWHSFAAIFDRGPSPEGQCPGLFIVARGYNSAAILNFCYASACQKFVRRGTERQSNRNVIYAVVS